MQLEVISKAAQSDLITKYRIALKPRNFVIFGYVLDSIDGLANHMKAPGTEDMMDVFVYDEQLHVFEETLELLRAYSLLEDS